MAKPIVVVNVQAGFLAIGQSHLMKPQKLSKKEHAVRVKKFVKIFKRGVDNL